MPYCGACNSFILGGGKSEGGKRFCNDKCLQLGRTMNYVGDIPEEIIAKRAWQMRDAACPRCGGPGPNDYHSSQQVISVVILTRTSNTTVFGCKSCGNRATLQATAVTLVVGWWGIPWGLIMTPIVLVTNLVALLQSSPPGPSQQLLEVAKLDMAAQLRQRVETGPEPSIPLASLDAPANLVGSPTPIASPARAHYGDAGYTPATSSGLAITSLVFALLSIFAFCLMGLSLLTSIVAVATGHMALTQIKRSGGRLTGDGMAITGLVIGYVMLLFSIVWVAFLILGLSHPDPRVRRELPGRDLARREFPGPEPVERIPPSAPVLPELFKPTASEPAPFQPPEFQPPVMQPSPMTPDPFTPPRTPRPTAAPSPIAPITLNDEVVRTDIVQAFPEMGWSVKSLAIAPNKRFLVAGKLDAKLLVLDLSSGKQVCEIGDLQRDMSQITSVAFSRDGKLIIAAGYKGSIATWKVDDNGDLMDKQVLASQPNEVRTMAISPTSNFLISGSSRGQLMWQPIVNHGTPSFRQLDALPRAVLAVHLPQTGMEALASDGQTLVAVDLKSAQQIRAKQLQKDFPHAAAFSSDGSRLAISSGYMINVWDTATQTHVLKIDTNHEIQWSVGFMPDGKRIYSGGRGRVTLWDTESGEPSARLDAGGVLYIKTIAISADSKWMATIPEAAGQTLTVMEIPERKRLQLPTESR